MALFHCFDFGPPYSQHLVHLAGDREVDDLLVDDRKKPDFETDIEKNALND
jgi:hypothetical protein